MAAAEGEGAGLRRQGGAPAPPRGGAGRDPLHADGRRPHVGERRQALPARPRADHAARRHAARSTRRAAARTSRARAPARRSGSTSCSRTCRPSTPSRVAGARRRVHDRALPGHGRRRRLDAALRSRECEDPVVKILVCVKRVPMTGGRIVAHRGRAGDRDEAPRLHDQPARGVRRRGGGAARRGSTAASRSCSRSGRPRPRSSSATRWRSASTARIHLVTDGEEWDPQATAGGDRRGDPRRRGGERAVRPDLLRQRVGRLGRLPGRHPRRARARPPVRDGAQGRHRRRRATVRCEQEVGGGRDVYVLPLPAVVTVQEGLNLPRYPSVPGRLRRQEEAARRVARRSGRAAAARAVAARRPGGRGEAGRDPRPGPRGGARGRRAAPADRGRVMTTPRPDSSTPTATRERRLAAGARARAQPRRRTSDALADRRPAPARPAPGGARGDVAHVAEHEALATFAPDAWAAIVVALAERARRRRPSSRRAPSAATRCWRTSPAHGRAARGELRRRHARRPAARVTRVRWGGSLLEEARAARAPRAPHGRRRTPSRPRRAGRRRSSVETFTPELADADLVVRVRERVAAAARRRLARRREGRRHRRPRRRLGRGLRVDRGARRAARRRRRLLARRDDAPGWRPHTDQVGQTGTKIAPDIYIACGVSAARRSTWPAARARSRSSPSTPTRRRRSVASADYAVIGDLHEVVPAISAELRKGSQGRGRASRSSAAPMGTACPRSPSWRPWSSPAGCSPAARCCSCGSCAWASRRDRSGDVPRARRATRRSSCSASGSSSSGSAPGSMHAFIFWGFLVLFPTILMALIGAVDRRLDAAVARRRRAGSRSSSTSSRARPRRRRDGALDPQGAAAGALRGQPPRRGRPDPRADRRRS